MKPSVPEWLAHLLQRPAAVLGGGVSGRAAAGLVRALGGQAVVYDRAAARPEEQRFGSEEARAAGLVVVSPGFPVDHEWVRTARNGGCEVLGELDLGALAWPGEVLAVTGTNGKTTLTELLTHALKLAGRDARAVGNIGEAFCDAWRRPGGRDSVAVCEVSSFQAETLRFFEASATIWSNFAEDHLERHGTLEAYFRAKYNLVRRTPSQRVYHPPGVSTQGRELGLELPAAHAVAIAGRTIDERVERTVFGQPPQRENYLLARALWLGLGLPEDKLVQAVQSFRIGPHRLARAGEVRGVGFWNDSKATNFHAVEAALASFDRPVLWIGGGRAKGGDVAAFVARVSARIRRAYLIGETRDRLAAAFRVHAVPTVCCTSLREAVTGAFSDAAAGEQVVLSPAFASFDMFKGYDDRGRSFEAVVAELAAGRRAASRPPLPSADATVGETPPLFL